MFADVKRLNPVTIVLIGLNVTTMENTTKDVKGLKNKASLNAHQQKQNKRTILKQVIK